MDDDINDDAIGDIVKEGLDILDGTDDDMDDAIAKANIIGMLTTFKPLLNYFNCTTFKPAGFAVKGLRRDIMGHVLDMVARGEQELPDMSRSLEDHVRAGYCDIDEQVGSDKSVWSKELYKIAEVGPTLFLSSDAVVDKLDVEGNIGYTMESLWILADELEINRKRYLAV